MKPTGRTTDDKAGGQRGCVVLDRESRLPFAKHRSSDAGAESHPHVHAENLAVSSPILTAGSRSTPLRRAAQYWRFARKFPARTISGWRIGGETINTTSARSLMVNEWCGAGG